MRCNHRFRPGRRTRFLENLAQAAEIGCILLLLSPTVLAGWYLLTCFRHGAEAVRASFENSQPLLAGLMAALFAAAWANASVLRGHGFGAKERYVTRGVLACFERSITRPIDGRYGMIELESISVTLADQRCVELNYWARSQLRLLDPKDGERLMLVWGCPDEQSRRLTVYAVRRSRRRR